jgi:hypothetical protein
MYKNNTKEPNAVSYLNSTTQRYHIINHLIEKNELVNYLEVGVFKGENIREVKAAHKDGVDPGAEGFTTPEVNYTMTSDDFFDLIKDHPEIKYDIIFIDGLHHADQVEKDIKNSLKHLMPDGYIVMHDCNPVSYDAQLIPRQTVVCTGNVWKAYVEFKLNNPTYPCCVVDTDFGVGVIHNLGTDYKLDIKVEDWEHFDSNRKELLNLISWDEFKETYK